MAQQSARQGRKNQMYSSCLEHAFMIWFRSENSHTGPQLHRCIRGRTDGSMTGEYGNVAALSRVTPRALPAPGVSRLERLVARYVPNAGGHAD
jgi:hypothetical protein